MRLPTLLLSVAVLLVVPAGIQAEKPGKPRARNLGVPFEGTPGPLNAITDVKGIEVGFVTLISGGGKLNVGGGLVRTGVTAIFPGASGPTTRSSPAGLL